MTSMLSCSLFMRLFSRLQKWPFPRLEPVPSLPSSHHAPIAGSAPMPRPRFEAVPRSGRRVRTAGRVRGVWWAVPRSIAAFRTAGTSAAPWLQGVCGSCSRSSVAPLRMVPACAGVPHPHRAQNLAGRRPRQGGSFVKRSFMNTPFTRALACETLASKGGGGVPRVWLFCLSASAAACGKRSAQAARSAARFISKTLWDTGEI